MSVIEVVDLTISSDEDEDENDETLKAIEECLHDCSTVFDEDDEVSSIYSVETMPCKEEPNATDTADATASDEEDSTKEEDMTLVPSREPCRAESPVSRDQSEMTAEADVGAEPALPMETSLQSVENAEQSSFFYDTGRVTVLVMPRDGHCLYRACVHQRRPRSQRLQMPTDEEVNDLRSAVADYMKAHRAELGSFFLTDVQGQTLNDSITGVENGDWGDQASISAIANLYSCPVEVYTEMGQVICHYPKSEATIGLSPNSQPQRPLRIAFRCWDDGDGIVYNHYDSVLKVVPDDPVSTPSLWPRPASPTPPRGDEVPDDHLGSPSRGASRGHRRRLTASPRLVKRLCADTADDEEDTRHPSPPPTTNGPLLGDATTSSLARGQAEDEVTSALRASQELVDRSSPTPGLVAPGSPSRDTQHAYLGKDDDGDTMERLLTTMFSPVSRVGDSNLSSCGSKTSTERGRIHLAPLFDRDSSEVSPLRGFNVDEDEVSTSQKTREWLRDVPSPPVDCSSDAGTETCTEDLSERRTSENTVSHSTCDVMTSVSKCIIDDSLQEWVCELGESRNHSRNRMEIKSYRTVSTNVRLYNGQLVGTFQVHSMP